MLNAMKFKTRLLLSLMKNSKDYGPIQYSAEFSSDEIRTK
jgi:hypothetical protein